MQADGVGDFPFPFHFLDHCRHIYAADLGNDPSGNGPLPPLAGETRSGPCPLGFLLGVISRC